MRLIDGQSVATEHLKRLKTQVAELKIKTGKSPGLSVIVVGNLAPSRAYVNRKKAACEEVGIRSTEHPLPETVSKTELQNLIDHLNSDPLVHGILLQLPLPKHLSKDEQPLLTRILPEKDVDGFHPANIGKLLLGMPCLKPCTPYGVMELLKAYEIDPSGKHVVIVGRSNIVGKPLAAMLMQKEPGANATVTVCHSQTPDIGAITRQADILIAAIGQPTFITADMVKENAVVIDVGINRVEDPVSPRGYRLTGDVDFEAIAPKTRAITPVPGGVGPMTIAMLLTNTLTAFEAACYS